MSEAKKIQFKYKFDDNYNPNYVTGALGGITPSGDIVASFFFERQSIPKKETYEITEEGSLNPEPIERYPEDQSFTAIRFIETGIIMNLDTAKKVRAWLDKNITSLESLNS